MNSDDCAEDNLFYEAPAGEFPLLEHGKLPEDAHSQADSHLQYSGQLPGQNADVSQRKVLSPQSESYFMNSDLPSSNNNLSHAHYYDNNNENVVYEIKSSVNDTFMYQTIPTTQNDIARTIQNMEKMTYEALRKNLALLPDFSSQHPVVNQPFEEAPKTPQSELPEPSRTNMHHSRYEGDKSTVESANELLHRRLKSTPEAHIVGIRQRISSGGQPAKDINSTETLCFRSCVHMVTTKKSTKQLIQALYFKLRNGYTNLMHRNEFVLRGENKVVQMVYHSVNDLIPDAKYVIVCFQYVSDEVVTPGNYLKFGLYKKGAPETADPVCSGYVRFYTCARTTCPHKCCGDRQ